LLYAITACKITVLKGQDSIPDRALGIFWHMHVQCISGTNQWMPSCFW